MDGRDRIEARFGVALHVMVRIGALILLLGWCAAILQPFLNPILWGIIIALSTHAGFVALCKAVGGRTGVAASIYVAIGLALVCVPAALLGETLFTNLKMLAINLADGTLRLPPPPHAIRSWVVVGGPLHDAWSMLSTNLDEGFKVMAPQLTRVGHFLFAFAGKILVGFFEFVIAIFIAAALLMNAARGRHLAGRLATRVAGAEGVSHADLAVRTVRSVARGVIGVALIQATLAGLGFAAIGIPAAGLLALVTLIVCIVQFPLMVMLIPVIIYAFANFTPLSATLFAVWCVVVALLEHVLKPLLLGRGVEVPMLVVFIGAIGGVLSSGILGLFVGPVVLTLGYTLVQAWLSAGADAVHDDAK